MITIQINGKDVKGKPGSTVLEVARDNGIFIPTLCYHSMLTPYGGCRLCIVEIEGLRGLPTSCTTPATEGMKVKTDTTQVQQYRKEVLHFILSEHPNSCLTCWRKVRCKPGDICLRHDEVSPRCLVCPKNYRCELQQVSDYIGIKEVQLPYKVGGKPLRNIGVQYQYKGVKVERNDPFYDRDYNLCILCGRCVRACQDICGTSAIAFTFRGSQALVGTAFGKSLEDSGCVFCGTCVEVCPTGALFDKKSRWQPFPDKTVKTICNYCGVGCQLLVEIKGDQVLRTKPDPQGPANRGQVCVKGRFGITEVIHAPDRLTTPLIKDKNGNFREASWDEALSLVASKMSQYKGNTVAVFGSGKCTNEDNYVIQKFGRLVLNTNNIDHCARLCHAPSVAGLAQSFGSGAMTNTIHEVGDAATILAIGTNTPAAHPVVFDEIHRAVQHGAKLIVVNPREIDLFARYAHLYLRIQPGTDVELVNGMMKIILDEGLEDKEFISSRCENFEEYYAFIKKINLDEVEKITGVPRQKIAEAARIYAKNRPSSIIYAMGITQHSHGTDNVLSLSNLAMLTGNVGKPSSGVNPLRGHNNVQGACDMGVLPDVCSGYQKVTDMNVREKFSQAWGCSILDKPGLTLTEIIDSIHSRNIKALYLMGENPAITDPYLAHSLEALSRLEFFVVQDLFLSETAKMAHVVFPACNFMERDGTFTNTERRVQLLRKAREPQGQSRPDWWIVSEVARRMGGKGFEFYSATQVFDEIARITPSYAGISYKRLEQGGIQWPCPTPDHPGTPIMHVEKFTRGKGRFLAINFRPPLEQADERYPLILSTERSLYQFHSGTLTRRVPFLNKLKGEELVEINPSDAERMQIRDGEVIKVLSRRGEVIARAKISANSSPGVISMTFHFAEAATNILTGSGIDPVAKIPEFKVSAVRLEKLKQPVS